MGQEKVVKEGKVVQALGLGKTEMVGNSGRKAKTGSSYENEGAAIYTTTLCGTRHGVDGSTGRASLKKLWLESGRVTVSSEIQSGNSIHIIVCVHIMHL